PHCIFIGRSRGAISFSEGLAVAAAVHNRGKAALCGKQWSHSPSAQNVPEEALLSLIEREVINQALIEEELGIKAATITTIRSIHQAQIPRIDNGERTGRLRHRASPQRLTVGEVAGPGDSVPVADTQ